MLQRIGTVRRQSDHKISTLKENNTMLRHEKQSFIEDQLQLAYDHDSEYNDGRTVAQSQYMTDKGEFTKQVKADINDRNIGLAEFEHTYQFKGNE